MNGSTWGCWILVAANIVFINGCGAPSPVETGGPGQGEDPSKTENAGNVEMSAIPGGWFDMGSSEEEEADQRVHRVYVSPFWIDKHLVTQEQYESLMGANPSHWKGPKNPVDKIRWRDAAAYCIARSRAEGLQPAYDPTTWQCNFEADGYRLPTEAEFEYALRAGTKSAYSFGDSPAELKRYAWFKENSPRGSHPVGEKSPNPWGLFDMVGNLWEWCNDFYQEDYYQHSPERDPRGPATAENRVVRGGCWNSRPGDCRSAYRNCEMPAFTDICFAKDVQGQIGFRCVRRRAAE